MTARGGGLLGRPDLAMDGWLHILLDGEPGPLNDEQQRFLTTAQRNSDRLMRLVGDLLLIGQMDAGQFTLDMTDVDLAELVGEQDGICQVEVTDSGIGVPPGERAHRFERFYRASTATGTAGGSGTRFVVEIPLHVAAGVSL
jgi:signal transduction histidine kinase